MRSQLPPAQLAKAALQRLAQARLEPTPENYARAYAIEAGTESQPAAHAGVPERVQQLLSRLISLALPSGTTRQELQTALREQRYDELLREVEKLLDVAGPGAQAEALAQAIERLVRGLERGGRQWTLARKKDGIARVLELTRTDGHKLVKRLGQLIQSWDKDSEGSEVEAGEDGGTPSQFFSDTGFADSNFADSSRTGLREPAPVPAMAPTHWPEIGGELNATVRHALRSPQTEATPADALMRELEAAQAELKAGGATPERAAQMATLCLRARHLLDHRRHLFDELGGLCRELSSSLVDLAEDDSWAQGQAEAMNQTLAQGLSGRGVRTVSELLAGTRERQRSLREERSRARDALKGLIQRMLAELGELGQHTDRFQNNVGRYADAIEQADSLESLAGTVREMVEESRSVQGLVAQTQARLTLEHDRAAALTQRVDELEGELRRLSNEVHTDQLTQVANRRGLIQAFGIEQAKAERESTRVALALLDIDNFKKLNDSLGHHAGDIALKSLAERTQASLRPGDMVARYGGEEFVLMLPDTPLDEAQAVLVRLQRSLSAALFSHEGKDVFVTFSAGVTLYRPGETLEAALDRADVALYEAKHTGKNRACIAE
ncbi:sensor domain-containing diguanylate cyclase [Roseateles saccharophilus]|uniref:diguanylate cyclase n=1 Tax=Roseateles saccharophilus TaxID=304 RepID=A0A4R3V686_ROSSA|nr:GGDEF domain-containing protein [Roseateles saccharophilus]MDG0834645.1 GGDEF domain-containing protein [Roseateles saccharophilus]TCU98877.1 diguanylate cyclase [Roseateles saccharophilus]